MNQEINPNDNMEYFTHNNYARPYKVTITNNSQVMVFKSLNQDEINYTNLVLNITPEQIFVGKSLPNAMTEFSGGHGDCFDGNSILLKVNDSACIYIGEKVLLFNTLDPIVAYHSPVGNNDVPYPYAIDSSGNYYLIIEKAILKSSLELTEFLTSGKDPYTFYYKASLITCDRGCVPPREPIFANNFSIEKFYIGKESYTMTYDPFPAEDYDRMTSNLGNHVYIRDKSNNKYEITKAQYIEIMESFGNTIGASPMLNIVNMETIS